MDTDAKKSDENKTGREPNILPTTEIVRNRNPKANENIRVRTEGPLPQNDQKTKGAGSEITDGEDG